MQINKIQELRNYLLKPTLKYAVEKSLFYKDSIGDKIEGITSVKDLKRLPFLSKEILNKNLSNILTVEPSNSRPSRIRLMKNPNISFFWTSGTTSGSSPTFVFYSKQEKLNISRLMQKYHKNADKEIPLTLNIIEPSHGTYSGQGWGPSVLDVFLSPVANAFWGIAEILKNSSQSTKKTEKITRIISSLFGILSVTNFLEQKGFECKSFGVKEIVTLGYFVWSKWRKYLEETWNCKVIDSYSMTEFPYNGAIECSRCKYYHFFPPTIIPEVICPVTKKRITDGIGVLVLTSLYPYIQTQPMIRYWVDDLVEIGGFCNYAQDIGIRFKGRLNSAVYKKCRDGVKYLIIPTDLEEILSSLPDVRIEPNYLSKIGVVHTKDIGLLCYRVNPTLENGILQIEIEISLRYDPSLYFERVKFLRQFIIDKLQRVNPVFKEELQKEGIKVRLKFTGPNETR